jgi:hypothetical protein
MIAAASENNALGKTMNWFGVYQRFQRFKTSLQDIILWGEKHSKVFQNHYLTEHIL